MKRTYKLFAGLALFGLLVTGCNNSNENEDTKYFSIIWKNYDGTVLETDNQVKENTMPSYDGQTPTKTGDAQYSYTFIGWSPEVVLATSDMVYTAMFSESLNSYTVTWQNWDGSVLETDTNVPYGTMPSFDGQTPSRQKDAQYSYRFSHWSPEITSVNRDIIYVAEYSREINYYTVTWQNWDGSVLETDTNVPYGTMPSFDGQTPSRQKDAQYSYTFNGWSPTVSQVAADVVYIAQFSYSTNNYVVTWQNWDGSVLETDTNVPYGTVPSYNGPTPSKDGDEQYSFVFSGWSPNITSVTGDATYTATFTKEVNKFTVTWKNWDGSVLETDTNVPYGSTPVYNSSTPRRDSTDQYSYTFSGWSPEIVPVTGDISYTAEYTSETRTYFIFWKNWDGSSLSSSLYRCEYGTMPVYHGNTPTRPSDDPAYSYVFVGWSPELAPVTCSTTYTAQYEYVENKYSVTWQNWDGTILETDTDVPYGSTPSYDGSTPSRKDSLYTYEFTGWSPNIVSVTNNITYIAQFNSSAITYTISYDLDGGIGDNPTSYSINSGNITLSQPSKNGYEFIGWTGSNGDVPEKNLVIKCDSGTNLSYTANWDIVVYNITYHLFDGTNNAKNPTTYTIEDTLELGSPNKTGYDFNGWYLDPDFTEEIVNLNGHYGDLDIYANFSGKKYSSTFVYEGKREFSVSYVFPNDHSYDKIETFSEDDTLDNIYSYKPTKQGNVYNDYYFDGWYYDSNFENVVKTNPTIVSNLTLYGRFLTKQDMGNHPVLSSVYFSASTNESKGEFYYCPGYFSRVSVRYTVRGVYNQYKKWSEGRGQVTVSDYYGGSSLGSVVNVWNDQSNSKEGTVSFEAQSGHVYYISVSATTDSSIYGTAYAYASISTQGRIVYPTFSSEIEQQFGQKPGLPVLSERPGYDLTWCDDEGNPIHETWDYLSDVSFHEVWTLHNYSIVYQLNGGVNNDLNPTSYTIEDTIMLQDPQREGYTFEGWFSDSDFTNEVTSINGEELRDYTLYAKWRANNYVATLDYNGGQNCRVVNFYSQGNLISSIYLYENTNLNYYVPEAPSPSLIFGGWYMDDSFIEPFSFNGIVDCDLNLHAKWIDILDYNHLDLGSNQSVSIKGNEYQYLAIVSPIYQTITITSSSDLDLFGTIYDSNWNEIISNDDISEDDLDFSVTINVSAGELYYIGYKANQKSVTGDCVISITGVSNPETYITGDVVETVSVIYDSPFVLPTPRKEGYVFVGWFDENGNQIDSSSWNYTEGIMLFAHWNPID